MPLESELDAPAHGGFHLVSGRAEGDRRPSASPEKETIDVNDMLMVGIGCGLGVALATLWMRRRSAKLESKIAPILEHEPDLTVNELAARLGLRSGWFATGRVIQALQSMVARAQLQTSVPAGTPLTKRVGATRYRLRPRELRSFVSLPDAAEHAPPPSLPEPGGPVTPSSRRA